MERVFTIKQARLLAGLTQEKAAGEMGISRDRYMRLERSPELVTVGQAREISRITGVPFEQISFEGERR